MSRLGWIQSLRRITPKIWHRGKQLIGRSFETLKTVGEIL